MARPSATHKGRSISIRLTPATQRLVEAEAERTNRSHAAVIEALAEEAARQRRFPLSIAQIRLALAYRDAFPEEIASAIAENERAFDAVRERYPFIAMDDLAERSARR